VDITPTPHKSRPWVWPAIAVAAMLVASVAITALVVGGGDGASRAESPPIDTAAAATTIAAAPAETTTTASETTIVETTVVATTVAPTTTLADVPPSTVAAAAAPDIASIQASFEALAHDRGAIDYSHLSEGPCGIYGLVVLHDHLEFYVWTGSDWSNISAVLGADGDTPPLTVTSRDYTDDGVIDFLVSYDGTVYGGRQFGGILYLRGCDWGWADITTMDGEAGQVLDALYYDDSIGLLYGEDILPGGGRTSVVVWYDPSVDSFFTVDPSMGD
jgi:hypothetical protein